MIILTSKLKDKVMGNPMPLSFQDENFVGICGFCQKQLDFSGTQELYLATMYANDFWRKTDIGRLIFHIRTHFGAAEMIALSGNITVEWTDGYPYVATPDNQNSYFYKWFMEKLKDD